MLKKVVFPAPFGPITLTMLPLSTSSVTSLTAVRPPKRFVICCASNSATLTSLPAQAHVCRSLDRDVGVDQVLRILPGPLARLRRALGQLEAPPPLRQDALRTENRH